MHRLAALALFATIIVGCSDASLEEIFDDLALVEEIPWADIFAVSFCDPHLVGDEDAPVEAIYAV